MFYVVGLVLSLMVCDGLTVGKEWMVGWSIPRSDRKSKYVKQRFGLRMECLSFNITLSHITLLIRLRAFAEIGIKIMIIPAV